MTKKVIFTVLILILAGGIYYLLTDKPVMQFASTGPATQEVSQNDSATTPEAVSKARASLSSEIHVPESSIAIESIEGKEWPNGCLGIAEKDVLCTEVITPGYRIELMAQGKTYYFRTNASGTVIREEK